VIKYGYLNGLGRDEDSDVGEGDPDVGDENDDSKTVRRIIAHGNEE